MLAFTMRFVYKYHMNLVVFPTRTPLARILFEKGIEQKIAAQAIGRSAATMSRYVNGKLPLPEECIPQLAELLGVDEEDIRGTD